MHVLGGATLLSWCISYWADIVVDIEIHANRYVVVLTIRATQTLTNMHTNRLTDRQTEIAGRQRERKREGRDETETDRKNKRQQTSWKRCKSFLFVTLSVSPSGFWWEHGCDYSSERNIWFCVVLVLFWHQSATTRVPLLIDDTDKWFLWKIMFAMANVIELLNRLNRSKQQNVKHKSKKQHLKKVRKPLKKVRSLFKKNIVTPMIYDHLY